MECGSFVSGLTDKSRTAIREITVPFR
jgi:hypothetical protein